ncbi:glycosyltransferase family 4 protein [Mongoliitalea daihaiensis]|uniref:glycosyltransferase family 4 protein n=1 Tax=Mongoliitalea daihaiensis TaxID=2782006 RepID=UPI001F46B24C|nr:glycosyltransferase [Mongoliitalea daihaiensis]UJP64475.1 glycosyltransferase [Mongoliitalea daihaiensis]
MSVKKIVWFTGFSSLEVQEIIKTKRYTKPFAPWIPAAVKSFAGNKNYEIHIISAHYYIDSYKKFNTDNIHYHFFNQGIPFFGNGWPSWFPLDHWTHYKNLRGPALKILRKINPDVIHFWGAEIPIASIFLDLNDKEKEKTIISIQGFKIEEGANAAPKVRVHIQNEVIKSAKRFFTTCSWMDGIVLKHSPNAEFYPLIYPINLPKDNSSIKKKYDLLFYARVTQSKGIEDLLEAVYLIKSQDLELSLLVMGPCDKEYQNELITKAEKLGISKQVAWAGFMETQEALYQKAQEAKIYVLPTHSEILASTVRESMAMKLPVITYATGCLPMLNSQNENVILVPTNDIAQLTTSIINLYNDLEAQESLKERAYNYIINLNSNQNFRKQLEAGYNNILTN